MICRVFWAETSQLDSGDTRDLYYILKKGAKCLHNYVNEHMATLHPVLTDYKLNQSLIW